MSLFTSKRERRLWLWTFAVIAIIYVTLGLAQTLAQYLRNQELLSNTIWLGLFLIGAVDEVIQALLPSRVFDIRDISFNLMAAVMAVSGSAALHWARNWAEARRSITKK